VLQGPNLPRCAAGYTPLREDNSDISAAESATYVPSSISVPTRGWMSTAGSGHEEAAFALDTRGRSCHLCYNPGHLLMDCPLLGAEAKHAAQKQRDQKIRENPAPRSTPSPPMASPTHPLTRPPASPRFGEFRRTPAAVHPVVEVHAPPGGPLPPVTNSSENERGDA
jgi:hypothetical protein